MATPGAARDPVTAYVGIGANLGDAGKAVREAIARIGRLPHTIFGSTSPSSMRSSVRPARRAVSAMSMCG